MDLKAIEAHLKNRNLVGGSTGWGIGLRHQQAPSADRSGRSIVPTRFVTLREYPLQKPSPRTHLAIDGLTVRIRGEKHQAGEAVAKLKAIVAELVHPAPRTIGETTYRGVTSEQSVPTDLGEDDNGCPQFTWSFHCVHSF